MPGDTSTGMYLKTEHARPSEKKINRTLRNSVRDGIAYSVMVGAAETYFSAFALFLKAGTLQIGLLASLPPLIGSFAQLFSAWLGLIVNSRRQIILFGTFFQGLTWIPLLLLPMLFPEKSILLLTACVTLYYIFGNLATPQWSSLMGDLVHEKQRGRYFARRNRLMSVTNFLALICAGLILHFFKEAGATFSGFAVIFIVAIVARLISVRYLSRMVDPPGQVATLELPLGSDWLQRFKGSPFLQFTFFMTSMHFMVGIASPYFVVYALRDLHFSYLEYMLLVAASVLAQFLTMNGWGRLSDAFGNRFILFVTAMIIPFVPASWIISQNFGYLVIAQILSGFCWAGFSLSAGNFLYDLIPASKRVTYLAVHNVFVAIGVFLGVTLGGLLASRIEVATTSSTWGFGWAFPFYYLFLISAIGRLIVFLVFLPRIKEVRPIRRPKASSVVLRATRSPALAGLVFEYGGSRLRRKMKRKKEHHPANP